MRWLNPARWLLLAALAGALMLGAVAWKASYDEDLREEGRAECREAGRVATEAQTARNRELQRAAEQRYVVQAATRDRFITRTITEVHHAAAPLATCPVPEPVRLRITAAAACARDDSGAACGAGAAVPDAR